MAKCKDLMGLAVKELMCWHFVMNSWPQILFVPHKYSKMSRTQSFLKQCLKYHTEVEDLLLALTAYTNLSHILSFNAQVVTVSLWTNQAHTWQWHIPKIKTWYIKMYFWLIHASSVYISTLKRKFKGGTVVSCTLMSTEFHIVRSDIQKTVRLKDFITKPGSNLKSTAEVKDMKYMAKCNECYSSWV